METPLQLKQIKLSTIYVYEVDEKEWIALLNNLFTWSVLQKDLAEHTALLKKQNGKLHCGTPSSSEGQ